MHRGSHIRACLYLFLIVDETLTESDIRILNIVLAKHLLTTELKGRLSGLNLNQDDRPPITKEEVVMFLQEIHQHQFANILSGNRGRTY